MSATVTHVGISLLGRVQGLMGLCDTDHVVPPGSLVYDLKTCENCARPFMRRRGNRLRYCGKCVASMLMPPDRAGREEYSAQLPDPNIAHLSYHLTRYDDSLLGGSDDSSGGEDDGRRTRRKDDDGGNRGRV